MVARTRLVARTGFMLTLGVSAFLFIWWALSGYPVVSAVCKEANYLTPYRGPFSSLCLQSLLSRESFGFARVDLGRRLAFSIQ